MFGRYLQRDFLNQILDKVNINCRYTRLLSHFISALDKRAPVLVTLCGIAWFATGQKVTEAMTIAAEFFVFYCRKYVIPGFCGLIAVDTTQILGILSKIPHGAFNQFRNIFIARCDR
ncbi:hypothetical protein EGU64_00370 [Achromobacter denitrificans]|nr:hypothetical protein EGU64_00370 [Achromobacter denitrificans]